MGTGLQLITESLHNVTFSGHPPGNMRGHGHTRSSQPVVHTRTCHQDLGVKDKPHAQWGTFLIALRPHGPPTFVLNWGSSPTRTALRAPGLQPCRLAVLCSPKMLESLNFFSVQLSFFGVTSQQIQFYHLPTSENPRGEGRRLCGFQGPRLPRCWGCWPPPSLVPLSPSGCEMGACRGGSEADKSRKGEVQEGS
jgi:hypothetical protein